MQHYRNRSSRFIRRPHSGFTLIEILVALAVMMLMMSIILVPVNMGLNMFHIGKARSEVQQANQLVINQLTAELKQAVYVFPNEAMPGITDKAPYTQTQYDQKPYVQINVDNLYADLSKGICDVDNSATSTNPPVNNLSRIDFLLPRKVGSTPVTPLTPDYYVVTYYARRLKPLMNNGTTNNAYDVFSNPIVLFRAQMPYRNYNSNLFEDSELSAINLNIFSSTTSAGGKNYPPRYPDPTASGGAGDVTCGGSPQETNAGSRWLTQNKYAEPNLEPIANEDAVDAGGTAAGSHTLIMPRDMALVAPNATSTTAPSYQPDSSFVCDDADGNGKIDRVTISMLTQKYDSIGAADDKSQQIRSTQTVALPNIK